MVSIRQWSLLVLCLQANLIAAPTIAQTPTKPPSSSTPKPALPIPVPKPPLTSSPSNEKIPPPPKTTPQSEEIIEETQEENQEQQEELSPEDAQQREIESDSALPKPEQNPFRKPNIDEIIQREFDSDMWKLLRGGLPCLETSATCLQQLQEKAVANSPLLKELDLRIGEANQKIEEAKSRNAKSINLAILTPALQYLLGPAPATGEPQKRGLIDNIFGIIRGDVGLINGLLNVIGVPIFQGLQGGNSDAQNRAIAISDISVRVAELQRSRAQLADTTREKVAVLLVKFDEARTQFQTSQVISSRAVDQFKVFEVRYTRGNSDTETYLSRQNQLDRIKADTFESWSKMRRSLFEIKLLVLTVKEAEL